MSQLELAYSRNSDPASSREGAKRARVGGQRATILRLLWTWESAFAPGVVAVDADQLYERYPYTQRSVWSTRLSSMAKPEAGLLIQNRETNPVTYALSEAGREIARTLP